MSILKKVCPQCKSNFDGPMVVCIHCGTLLMRAVTDKFRKYYGRIVLEKYRIEKILSVSTSALVFGGRDLYTSERVAIKLLPPTTFQGRFERRRDRFLRQVENTKKLSHENIVQLKAHGTTKRGEECLVFDFVEDALLLDQFRDRLAALPAVTTVEIVRQICDALEHAHKAGVYHDDLSPENILLVRGSDDSIQVRIIDFAKGAPMLHGDNMQGQFTEVGDIFGNAEFISPEVALGQDVNASANVYSLGCIVYALLSKEVPHSGSHWAAIILRRVAEQAPPLKVHSENELYRGLEMFVGKCLELDAANRFKTIKDVRKSLLSVPVEKTAPTFSELKSVIPSLCFAFLLMASICVSAANADVHLPNLFSDNMVLQANSNPKVFGTASPDEKIQVEFAGHKLSTRADKNGDWAVALGPLKTGQKGNLQVKGNNFILVKNVVAGEVWLCSGQSNMAFSVKHCSDAKKLLAQPDNPDIRIFNAPPDMANHPMKDIYSKWQVCDKDVRLRSSALAYMFAEHLQKTLHTPVGIIHSSYFGSSIYSWISDEGMSRDRALQEKLGVKNNAAAAYMQLAIEQNHKQRQASADKLQPIPFTLKHALVPSVLYNAMIAPLTEFGIKGIAWYQGEADAEDSKQYGKLFSMLISDWRSKWNRKSLPFIYVQLPNFETGTMCKPTVNAWAELRQAQQDALKLPATAMVVSIDLGEPHEIHPKDKTVLAGRLSDVVLEHVYKQTGVDSTGPELASLSKRSNTLVCKFNHAAGLHAKNDELKGFEITGDGVHYISARANIRDSTVTVECREVPRPIGVRYAWSNNPTCNLYNAHNLPAAPFRARLPGK